MNSGAKDADPHMSFDGLKLLFDSDRPGGEGKSDLWVCSRRSRREAWGRPFNLGEAPFAKPRHLNFKPILSPIEVTNINVAQQHASSLNPLGPIGAVPVMAVHAAVTAVFALVP